MYFSICALFWILSFLKILHRQNIRPIFQIIFIRVDLNHPEYLYILRFCCQMSIHSKDISNVLEFIEINYDNTSYWLYVLAEKIVYFL